MIHYQVKFERNGKTVYGIVREFDTQAEQAKTKGFLLVDDAILPIAYEVKESEVVDIKHDEFNNFVDEEFKKAEKISDGRYAQITGTPNALELVGALFGIGVADGTAYYVVTRVKGKKCDVEWRGFSPDRYIDHYYGLGRKNIPITDIQRNLGFFANAGKRRI